MNHRYQYSVTANLILIFLTGSFVFANILPEKRDRSFDLGWKFSQGEFYYGAERPDFDDRDWRIVDLPHDWSIEDVPAEIDSNAIGPFSKLSPGHTYTGYFIGGFAWYRKAFTLDSVDEGKQIYIRFDGIYMESEVWINGHRLGHHANGYMPFYYDITSFINPVGQANVVAVLVQNIGMNSRWYSGSGMYRHVWLTVVDPVHVDVWGTYVTTPTVSNEEATIHVQTDVNNNHSTAANIDAACRILDDEGQVVNSTHKKIQIPQNGKETTSFTLKVKRPNLWSPDSPTLYHTEVILKQGEQILDRTQTPFGIRSITYNAEKGFLLNGKSVLLKGACMHHDNGILGSATYDRAEERRVEIMKANGFNAIRTSHNPPSKQFLDACDRLGMLVMDEAYDTWQWAKRLQGVHRFFDTNWESEIEAFVKRDRNHPSVVMWSIGNEIRERVMPSGLEIAQNLKSRIQEFDRTRPVTEAICGFWDNPGTQWSDTPPAFDILDIGGYNYLPENYETDHTQFPDRIMVGTESFPLQAQRYWQQVEKHPYVIGDFVWTGMDYLGESGIGHSFYVEADTGWVFGRPSPWFNAWCGDIDIIGQKKMPSFYRDVVWSRSKLEMAVHEPIPKGMVEKTSAWGWPLEYQHWNWAGLEGESLQVSVYSSCQKVKLMLNDKIIDEKEISPDTLAVHFQVPYEPGVLKAIGYENKQPVVTQVLRTSGNPAQIRLTADRKTITSSRQDLAFVLLEVCDAGGQRIPTAELEVALSVEGCGELLAAGSASPNYMESFKDATFRTFEGRGLIVLRPKNLGEMRVKASCNSLQSNSITIHIQ